MYHYVRGSIDSLLCVYMYGNSYIYIYSYIYGNVSVGTDLALTVAVMKQSDQKHLTEG